MTNGWEAPDFIDRILSQVLKDEEKSQPMAPQGKSLTATAFPDNECRLAAGAELALFEDSSKLARKQGVPEWYPAFAGRNVTCG